MKLLILSLILALTFTQYVRQPYSYQHNNALSYSNRLYSPHQYHAFNNAYDVNDAIRINQLNTARDASMAGATGNIRRSLKSEIDRIIAAETMKIGGYNSPFGLPPNLMI